MVRNADQSQLSLFLLDPNAPPGYTTLVWHLNAYSCPRKYDSKFLHLLNPESTVFRTIQRLPKKESTVVSERQRRIWEPEYTIIYRVARPEDLYVGPIRWEIAYVEQHLGTKALPKQDVVAYLQKQGRRDWLKLWKLSGKTKSITKSRNCRQVSALCANCTVLTGLVLDHCCLQGFCSRQGEATVKGRSQRQ